MQLRSNKKVNNNFNIANTISAVKQLFKDNNVIIL